MSAKSVCFEQVRDEEHDLIAQARFPDGAATEKRQKHKHNLLGLALSGGGIRSATFNLGLLQALARARLLSQFDYLSTVSGGGYIGSWLSAWVKRAPGGIDEVENALASGAGDSGAGVDRARGAGAQPSEPAQVSFLREYSNFLTPRTGWFSTDTLTGVTTYLRNLLLNQAILVLLAAAIVLGPWFLGGAAVWLAGSLSRAGAAWGFFAIAAAGLLIAAFGMGSNLNWLEFYERRLEGAAGGSAPKEAAPAYCQPRAIWWSIVVPLQVSAVAASLGVWAAPALRPVALAVAAGLVFVALILVLALARMRASRRFAGTLGDKGVGGWARTTALIVSTGLGAALLAGLAKVLSAGPVAMDEHAARVWHALVWGAPAILAIVLLGMTLLIGVSGRSLSEYTREWYSRFGALVLRAAILWIVLFGVSVYGALAVWKLGAWASGLGLAWVLSTAAAVLTGMSPSTGQAGSRRWLELVPKIGPYVFVLGLLVAVAAGLYAVSFFLDLANEQASPCSPDAFLQACTANAYFAQLTDLATPAWQVLGWGGLLALAGLLLSRRVDINVFSFHGFYRNRLVRCYLGASNARKGLPFIDFDPDDNLKLHELEKRPLHLVNAALNLTGSKRLSWQERKAGAFVLSPLYCGYEFPQVGDMPPDSCFQRTQDYVRDVKGYLALGTAMTISGAAASPNMGYHSTPTVAFLLTVFNVRLGWWIQNPREAHYWHQPGPGFGLRYLFAELLGRTDETRPFVYLSDGGHFDNLGIYELVRRRCRFIVASDCGQDAKFQFEDLGNAIRKCRIDLNVRIEMDKRTIAPDPRTGRSLYHCAVGTILYPDREPGYLLYIKPSLTGNEPADVLQYAAARADFPHETTADQWFSESQFESYRQLGQHIGHAVLNGAGVSGEMDRESIFVALKERWFPPSGALQDAFTRHSDQLRALDDAQRQDPRLKFLDAQVYPEWDRLGDVASGGASANLWLPQDQDELRAGFYHCKSMLELMENVYVDLNLEQEWEHPDNRGWINHFRHWSWSGMFKVTYSICCAMCGARFQRFCERRLDLWPGKVSIAREGLSGAGLSALLDGLRRDKQLNFAEAEMIRRVHAAQVAFDSIRLLQIVVTRPDSLGAQALQRASQFIYTFGFALSSGPTLIYFRVQDHLRKMGHGRRALARLYYGDGLDRFDDAQRDRITAALEDIEPQDFDGFERLFKSVVQRGRDFQDERP